MNQNVIYVGSMSMTNASTVRRGIKRTGDVLDLQYRPTFKGLVSSWNKLAFGYDRDRRTRAAAVC